MRFEIQVTVHVPRQSVWDFLWDVPRLTACVPGREAVQEIEPNTRYQGGGTPPVADTQPRSAGGIEPWSNLPLLYLPLGPHRTGWMPAAPAIANAISRAIGVRLTALPLIPERVWQAIRVAQAHQTS
jgi:hypothetical protein